MSEFTFKSDPNGNKLVELRVDDKWDDTVKEFIKKFTGIEFYDNKRPDIDLTHASLRAFHKYCSRPNEIKYSDVD